MIFLIDHLALGNQMNRLKSFKRNQCGNSNSPENQKGCYRKSEATNREPASDPRD